MGRINPTSPESVHEAYLSQVKPARQEELAWKNTVGKASRALKQALLDDSTTLKSEGSGEKKTRGYAILRPFREKTTAKTAFVASTQLSLSKEALNQLKKDIDRQLPHETDSGAYLKEILDQFLAAWGKIKTDVPLTKTQEWKELESLSKNLGKKG